MTQGLYNRIQSVAETRPGSALMRGPDGQTLSYGYMLRAVERYGNALAALGVTKGDRVAVQVEKSIGSLWLYLACLRGGYIYLPMNMAYQDGEVDYLIGNSEPSLFVCDPKYQSRSFTIREKYDVRQVLTLDDAGAGSLADAAAVDHPMTVAAALEGDDLAAILYTSGTTGRPKGAMLSNENLLSNAEVLVDAWGFSDSDVLLHALPIFHVHGLFVACHCVLLSGASMIWMPSFDAVAVTAALPNSTVMMGVPTFYTRLLRNGGFGKDVCGKMRLFISGSAPLLTETWNAFKDRTGFDILERYGMTEIAMHTSNPLNGARRPGTVGPVLPGSAVRVAAESGALLDVDEIGGLEVKGPNVFSGYWRNPEKTDEEFTSDGWFKTGDQAKIDDQGYVHIVGRAKDMVITGGFNVYPKEIEAIIDDLPGLLESAVIGVPHPDFGEAVVAVVIATPAPDATSPIEAVVIDAVASELAKFKVPKRVMMIDELPRNAMGKVQKAALRERFNWLFQND